MGGFGTTKFIFVAIVGGSAAAAAVRVFFVIRRAVVTIIVSTSVMAMTVTVSTAVGVVFRHSIVFTDLENTAAALSMEGVIDVDRYDFCHEK